MGFPGIGCLFSQQNSRDRTQILSSKALANCLLTPSFNPIPVAVHFFHPRLDKSRRTEYEMDQFRPQQHGTRLRSAPRDPEDRSYSGSVTVETRPTRPEDTNVYESFEERRRSSYDDPYHRTREYSLDFCNHHCKLKRVVEYCGA
ncbi:uncharacterized protein CEXT_597511 [Caerostris extrusa]|uniref:Uncharacterized protein n=1 Tax=Caerostris extrusa TaxID=172846 RepID=A0AAV4WGS8_CAEEX|nr:uncharacterized protein CEXT_597511 [Caerostris extrusa]